MTDKEQEVVASFLRKLGLKAKDPEIFFEALTHTSYANEQKQAGRRDVESNERLEFLGDAVVDLLVCDILYRRYPNASEGEMSRVKAAVASEKVLSMIAREMELGKVLFLGRGEEMTGGRDRDSILADAVEAVLGAVYIEGGLELVKRIFQNRFEGYVDLVMRGKLLFDYKTALQEITQREFKSLPQYRLVSKDSEGFTVEVLVNGRPMGKGKGRSKKEAEKAAAKEAYRILTEETE